MSCASFVPQLIKIAREKVGEAVSVGMYLLTMAAFGLWSTYGLMLKSWPLMISNLICLALASAILVLKLRYKDR